VESVWKRWRFYFCLRTSIVHDVSSDAEISFINCWRAHRRRLENLSSKRYLIKFVLSMWYILISVSHFPNDYSMFDECHKHVQCEVFIGRLYSVQCTLYTVQRTVYIHWQSVHSRLHRQTAYVLYIVYNVCPTLFQEQSTFDVNGELSRDWMCVCHEIKCVCHETECVCHEIECVCHVIKCVCHEIEWVCHVIKCVCHEIECVCQVIECVCHVIDCVYVTWLNVCMSRDWMWVSRDWMCVFHVI